MNIENPATDISSFSRPLAPSERAWHKLRQSAVFWFGLWLGLHVVLGYLMKLTPLIPTAHAILSLAIGLWAALAARRREYAIYAMAYLAGSEVLWRMNQGQIFWEYGKYAVVAVALLTMLRRGLFLRGGLPLTYFILLLPSIVLPMSYLKATSLQQSISFNLSGPFSLAVCCWLGANLKLTKAQVMRGCLILIGPLIGIASTSLSTILQADEVFFGASSNHLASGGYGPNQVSSTLGLGLLVLFLVTMLEKVSRVFKVFLFAVMLWLGAQCVITFSRTGLYLAAAASFVSALFFLRDRKTRFKVITLGVILSVAAFFFLLPALENFTQGALGRRFSNLSTTGRDQIVLMDFDIWGEHPIFGVGPGQASNFRTGIFQGVAAHTEFSRLLAEHGVFGLCAAVLLIALGTQNFLRAQSHGQRAFALALITWSCLFMVTSAMRTAMPGFLFGLAAVSWHEDEADAHSS
jgi:hypothetical protein